HQSKSANGNAHRSQPLLVSMKASPGPLMHNSVTCGSDRIGLNERKVSSSDEESAGNGTATDRSDNRLIIVASPGRSPFAARRQNESRHRARRAPECDRLAPFGSS